MKVAQKFVSDNGFYLAIIAIIIYAFSQLKNSVGGAIDSAYDIYDDVDNERPDYTATIGSYKAQSISEMLYNAFLSRNPFTGTDFDRVKLALDQINTQADFNAVYNAFGKRRYSMFWGNEGDPIFSDKKDLITWFINELSDTQIEEVKRDYPHLSIF